MGTGGITGRRIWCYSTPTVTTRRMPGCTIDRVPRAEELDEGSTGTAALCPFTSGSESAVGRATALLTVTT